MQPSDAASLWGRFQTGDKVGIKCPGKVWDEDGLNEQICLQKPTILQNIIEHLNDSHAWSFGQIADWLEASGNDLPIKPRLSAGEIMDKMRDDLDNAENKRGILIIGVDTNTGVYKKKMISQEEYDLLFQNPSGEEMSPNMYWSIVEDGKIHTTNIFNHKVNGHRHFLDGDFVADVSESVESCPYCVQAHNENEG